MSVGQGWDGRGLPPAAAARMERFAADGIRTSLLDVPGVLAIGAAGLEPVGEVMGTIVQNIGWSGWQGCGMAGFGLGGGFSYAGRTVTSSESSYAAFAPYVNALYHGYGTAIARMVAEAQAMGADGVVGVRLTVSPLDSSSREYVALGSAVRSAAPSRHKPARPFVAALPGADVLKLVQAGWVPAAVALGISVGVRHDDYATRSQASSYSWNTEVSGYTELVQQVRADARTRFRASIHDSGADGGLVSHMALHIWSIEPGENHRDHVAESTVIGTAIAQFHRGQAAPTSALTVMPLR